MKKTIFVFISLMGIFAGCQIESINEPSRLDKSTVYEASTEVFTPQTKTLMTSDKQVVWTQNDRLAIFQGCAVADEFLVTDSSDGKTIADFNILSDNSEVNGSFSAGTEVPCNVAFYPYATGLTLIGATLEDEGTAYKVDGVVLPAEQTYVAGSFANGSFPMVAVTKNMADHTLRFRNVLGALKLQLKGTQAVKSIKVTGKNNEILSGAAVVTAYTNNLAPAITMTATDEASKSVTLNCGSGVQLNESSAIDFIIALPPVLFSNGFVVTVTDSESQTYTVETDKANTVLRSSLLVMPAFKLGETPGGDSGEGLVEIVFLDRSSLTMAPGTSYTFESEIDPTDATYPTLTWSSSDNSVATVDQSGKVTAVSDGTATITALAVGGANATCSVTVKSATVVADTKYVVGDADYGYGIVIGDVVWAPVNCGYEPANGDYKGYPYGKLYQWGRKYGQGYSTRYDATEPEIVEGPVMPSVGKSEESTDVFFTASESPYDWCKVPNGALWNSGTEEAPVKTDTDPCPAGWRVPTYEELSKLNQNSLWATNDEGQKGRFFCGEYTFIEGAPSVFFPAAGKRDCSDGGAGYRGLRGHYWSSRPNNLSAYYASPLFFHDGWAIMTYYTRADGFSVRCVQE
ncbi:MAG: Ig-like domain-containing protein [Bacteroidales bacterium]|nr:Ig-like domain-containing protein [Bacteroidales bacterium]